MFKYLSIFLVGVKLAANPMFFGAHRTTTADSFPYIFDQASVVAFDPTKQAFEATITVVTTARYAIGVCTPLAADGKTMTYKTNGVSIGVHTINYTELANVGSTYAEDGVLKTLTPGVYTIRVEVTTGPNTIEGMIIRKPDAISNIVEDQGTGQHCNPLACTYNNHIYRVYSEIYTGDVYLSIDGVPKGIIFTVGAINEHYHNGCAVLPIVGGVLLVQVGHNQSRIHFRYMPLGDFASISPDRFLGNVLSDYTYCFVRQSAVTGNVMVLTRGSDEDVLSHNIILMTLTNPTNLVASVATGTIDVVASDGDPYPRYISIEDNGAGTEAAIIGWDERDIGVAWRTMSYCIYAPASGGNGKFYSLKGDEASEQTNRGSNAVPRFNNTMQNTVTSEGAGVNIIGRIASIGSHYGQRYGVEASIGKIITFPVAGATPHGKVFGLFVDNGLNNEDSYGMSALRYFQQVDTNRMISPYNFFEPTKYIPDPNSYRVSASMFWQDENPSGNNVALVMTDRGTRFATNRYSELTDLYYDWGGTNIANFQIQDPFGTPVFNFMARNQAVGISTALGFVKVFNLTNVVEYETSDNILHPTHAQSHRAQTIWANTGGVTNSIESGYHYYKNITITNNNGSLTNFPVYLTFTGDTDIGGRAAASGNNIRFTQSDGTTLLNYRRRAFSIGGGAATGTFVVATDLPASGNTTIRMWYDNSAMVDGQSTPDKVWDSGYVIIASLDQDPSGTAPQLLDYSYQTNNGTAGGSMVATNSITGLANNALYFSGSQFVDFGNMLTNRDRFGDENSTLTIESFVNMSTAQLARDGMIYSKGVLSSTTTAGPIVVYRDDVGTVGPRNNTWAVIVRDNLNATTARIEGADGAANTAGVYYNIAATFKGNDVNGLKLYINGVEDPNSPVTTVGISALKPEDDTSFIGKQGIATTTTWNGPIDETRLSFVVRNQDWIRQTYHNIADSAHLITFSSEIFQ